jgi:uncharacterized repeat protein (TIGR01451 family)
MLTTAMTETTVAKSLYVIGDIWGFPSPVQAYNIGVDGKLTFQAEYGIPRHGLGAVGLAIDPDSEHLFVTYENSYTIQLINARTMTDEGITLAPGARDLAGIVYDHGKQLLYCVDRRRGTLYVYDWEPGLVRLAHAPGSPFELAGATAWGIALDEIKDLLYVANNSTMINVYKTSDWSLVRTISVKRIVHSVAVDAVNGLAYSGGGWSGNPYLSQYNLATDTEAEVQVETKAGVMGLAVDQATGLVYMTTGVNNDYGGDNLLVYDTSLNQIDLISGFGNPTDVVIPTKDVSYNPLNLSKSIIAGAVDDNEPVGVRDNITYRICFDNKRSQFPITNVSLVDTLPAEVNFVAANTNGVSAQYDPATHTFTWLFSSLQAGASVCLDLAVRVKQGTVPGTTITNSVTIDSDQTPPTTRTVEAITRDITYNPLNLSKSIAGAANGQIVPVDVGDTITYNICFDNNDNDYTVTNVLLLDNLPDQVSFVTADGDGVFGAYDPAAHTYTWSYPSLAPGSGSCLRLVVQVKQDTAPLTIITNSATVDTDQTEPATRSARAITKDISYKALNLSKKIISGTDGQTSIDGIACVRPGETIRYGICFDNNDNDHLVTNVSVVDTLPADVNFVTASEDGVLGQYDANSHTYTWLRPVLAPDANACLELVVQIKQETPPDKAITNSVTISSDQTPPTTAHVDVVTCGTPLSAEVCIIPSVIRRRSYGSSDRILAIVQLPAGVRGSDIKDRPLILYPAGIEAGQQRIYDTGSRVKIIASFDKTPFMDAVRDDGKVKLEVAGQLVSGQSFRGEQTVHVTR